MGVTGSSKERCSIQGMLDVVGVIVMVAVAVAVGVGVDVAGIVFVGTAVMLVASGGGAILPSSEAPEFTGAIIGLLSAVKPGCAVA